MVKAYLRYEQADAFGVIASGSNIVHDLAGKHVLTAALESIAVWNLKQGNLVSAWLLSLYAALQDVTCACESLPYILTSGICMTPEQGLAETASPHRRLIYYAASRSAP